MVVCEMTFEVSIYLLRGNTMAVKTFLYQEHALFREFISGQNLWLRAVDVADIN